MPNKRDYYDVLGVTKSSPADAIKKAYRKLALQFHPDRNKAVDAETKFKEINEAYEVLSNPQKKQTYDQFGHAAFDPSAGNPFSGNPFGQAGGRTTYYTSGQPGDFADMFGGFSDPFDIFSSIFGGGGGSPFRRGPAKPHYSMKISFMEAAKGGEKSFVHQGKKHTVKIPAGASDGTRIRYNDFDVSFDVQSHKTFKREGYDLFVDQNISFVDAILGVEVSVPTLDGDLKIKVRAGTQPGSMLRLSGKGVKHLEGQSHGDLYIRLVITLPEKLTGKQKELLKAFDKS